MIQAHLKLILWRSVTLTSPRIRIGEVLQKHAMFCNMGNTTFPDLTITTRDIVCTGQLTVFVLLEFDLFHRFSNPVYKILLFLLKVSEVSFDFRLRS